MAISASRVVLYAADTVDYELAIGVAATANIPNYNVIGDFATAWNLVKSGNYLVIAVGGPANNALYYNPGGWAGHSTGSTPFETTASQQVSTLPGANYYENASGNDRTQTLYLATVFAFSAVYGITPSNYTNLPAPAAPVNTCSGNSSVNCPC